MSETATPGGEGVQAKCESCPMMRSLELADGAIQNNPDLLDNVQRSGRVAAIACYRALIREAQQTCVGETPSKDCPKEREVAAAANLINVEKVAADAATHEAAEANPAARGAEYGQYI